MAKQNSCPATMGTEVNKRKINLNYMTLSLMASDERGGVGRTSSGMEVMWIMFYISGSDGWMAYFAGHPVYLKKEVDIELIRVLFAFPLND